MDGKYHLNARGVNYSNGGLKTVFEQIFRRKKFGSYDFQSVLLLGLGGGSVVSLICETYGKSPKITGIEGDRVVLELSEKYFGISRFPTLHAVYSDAIEFLEQTQETYDLVIVDLFVNDQVPAQFHTEEFVRLLRSVARPESVVIYNKMTHRKELKAEMAGLRRVFESVFPFVSLEKAYSYGVENSMLWCDTIRNPAK